MITGDIINGKLYVLCSVAALGTLSLKKVQASIAHIKEIRKINCTTFLKFTNTKQKKPDFHENFEKYL